MRSLAAWAVVDHLALVHALHRAVRQERAAGDEHPLDVLRLAVEDELGDGPEHRGEVHRSRVDDDDVRLLARGQRADGALHVEHLRATHRRGAQHLFDGRRLVHVGRQGALQPGGGAHVVEHVDGVIGAAVEAEADADPGGLHLRVTHDAGCEPHVAERLVGHRRADLGQLRDLVGAQVDRVGDEEVRAERERARVLEDRERVSLLGVGTLEDVNVELHAELLRNRGRLLQRLGAARGLRSGACRAGSDR